MCVLVRFDIKTIKQLHNLNNMSSSIKTSNYCRIKYHNSVFGKFAIYNILNSLNNSNDVEITSSTYNNSIKTIHYKNKKISNKSTVDFNSLTYMHIHM